MIDGKQKVPAGFWPRIDNEGWPRALALNQREPAAPAHPVRARACPRAGHAACQPGKPHPHLAEEARLLAVVVVPVRKLGVGRLAARAGRRWGLGGAALQASCLPLRCILACLCTLCGLWLALLWLPGRALAAARVQPLTTRPPKIWRRARLHAPPAASLACGSHWRACDTYLRRVRLVSLFPACGCRRPKLLRILP